MMTDSTGTFAISLFLACVIGGLIAGAIIGGTVGGITAYNLAAETGSTGWELFGWTALGVFGGAVIGGAIGAVAGAAVGGILTGAAELGAAIGSGIGLMALVGGGTMGGGAALVTVSAGAAVGVGAAVGALGGLGVVMMSKPNSGRPRYSDSTGYTDNGRGGQRPMTSEEAHNAYKASKDPVYRANLKRWMKGMGYRTSHLKGLIFLPLVGEWMRRMFTGEW